MPALPPRLSLEQVRRLAKDLLRDLKDGDRAAIRRFAVVSAPSTLPGAQRAIAREYGFPSWARLKRDVELREILDSLDVGRLRALVAEEPDLASTTMEHWVDHPAGASPLGYVAMLRYDTTRGIWREVDGAGAIAASSSRPVPRSTARRVFPRRRSSQPRATAMPVSPGCSSAQVPTWRHGPATLQAGSPAARRYSTRLCSG